MIARHEEQQTGHDDVWGKLAAPLPPSTISWRQDGRPIERDGRYIARFVAYVDANTVRDRLDSVVPGEWNLTLELLPALTGAEDGSMLEPAVAAFKARLQILGVVREDVGTGRDYKQAATDAFKRVAVRFGVAHELYQLGQNWVRMDGDGKYAKPLEDPQAAYERRYGTGAASASDAPTENAPAERKARRSALAGAGALSIARDAAARDAAGSPSSDVPSCPKCGGRMWDNRLGKRNPRAPDFKCRDRNCDGVIWPPRESAKAATARDDATTQGETETESLILGDSAVPF
ncbi:MAG TPA: Rad52/Rad22 family DNA repair protein [Gemmatimonadaceae bacterium]|nr:Rad52/Rad22 family DNA repair protein [Gemmatimonadaceae bacterium]